MTCFPHPRRAFFRGRATGSLGLFFFSGVTRKILEKSGSHLSLNGSLFSARLTCFLVTANTCVHWPTCVDHHPDTMSLGSASKDWVGQRVDPVNTQVLLKAGEPRLKGAWFRDERACIWEYRQVEREQAPSFAEASQMGSPRNVLQMPV